MWLFSRRSPAPHFPPQRAMGLAVEEYLAISRSPLRRTEPDWWALAESAAWDGLNEMAPAPVPAAATSAAASPPAATMADIVFHLRAGGA